MLLRAKQLPSHLRPFPLLFLFTHSHITHTLSLSCLFESLAMFISICARKILEEIVENNMHNRLFCVLLIQK